MSEGYLSVLINRQIPDSIWLEKSEKPLSGTEQDPFVVAFEQHFGNSDAAHKFVVGKLAESGFEEWNGGQFRGPTTRDVIGLLSKASKGEPPSQPNHENLSLADLPALTEAAASVRSEDPKVTPTDYFVGVGLVIFFTILVGIHLGGSSQDVADASSPQSPMTISDVRTYWLNGYPVYGGEACVPAIAFSVKNNTANEIANAIFSATFKEPSSKKVFGTATTSLDGNLPAGYSLLLAAAGAAVGVFVAWVAFNNHMHVMAAMVIHLAVTPGLAIGGIIFAMPLAAVGGLFPAARAARMPIADALRAT